MLGTVRKRTRYGLLALVGFVLIATIAAIIMASILAKRFEPALRDQAIRYLRERFHGDVELAALHVTLPKLSTMQVLLIKN